MRLWDLTAGKSSHTLTHHKKAVRDLTVSPTEFSFVTAGADNLKKWQCRDGVFLKNLMGHNAIVNALTANEVTPTPVKRAGPQIHGSRPNHGASETAAKCIERRCVSVGTRCELGRAARRTKRRPNPTSEPPSARAATTTTHARSKPSDILLTSPRRAARRHADAPSPRCAARRRADAPSPRRAAPPDAAPALARARAR